VQIGKDDMFEALQMSAAKTAVGLAGRYPLPNLIAIMENLMQRTTPPVHLTRRTLLEVFRRSSNKQAAIDNPQEFALGVVRILKEKLADHLVNGIRYEKIGEWYEMSQLQTDVASWEEYLVPAQRSIYDYVVFDSEVERAFVEGLEKLDYVKLYVKLPGWFVVKTPVGDYIPDWAIVMEERDQHGQATGESLLYLVRETKGENWRTDLRPDERRKIACGERHFKDALGVDYEVVTTTSELR
jgi:type III restriction enzyme